MSWSNLYFYAFPPFGLTGVVLVKIKQEQCSGIMVMPWWKTQVRFPMMVKSLVNISHQISWCPSQKNEPPLN